MSEPEISGPRPGDLGWLIGLHGRWYADNVGFDGLQFERTVASIAIDVAARLSSPQVNMLVARDDGGPLATISADGEDKDDAGRGHIRIFIAEPRAKGRGLGQRLVAAALASLRDGGLPGAYLDTFAGLDAARAIYLKAGFRLCAEDEGTTWGSAQREQRYELDF
ncbi:MAG: GNAT family N-acetyltransferase [Pseudomonadota bacterium]